jgi:hypothetical protein
LRFNAFEKRTLLEFTAEEYLSRSAKERKQKEPAEEHIHATKNKIRGVQAVLQRLLIFL